MKRHKNSVLNFPPVFLIAYVTPCWAILNSSQIRLAYIRMSRAHGLFLYYAQAKMFFMFSKGKH